MLEALKPLGEEYGSVLKTAFTDGWIDVQENRGKRTGAYSWGCYGCHPFVLLNWQGTINDVFTLAHELGHASIRITAIRRSRCNMRNIKFLSRRLLLP